MNILGVEPRLTVKFVLDLMALAVLERQGLFVRISSLSQNYIWKTMNKCHIIWKSFSVSKVNKSLVDLS